jgi:mannose-6-phosphate isomerase-like protein (cupin superfamily)
VAYSENARIVTTGHDASGRGMVVRDEMVSPSVASDQWRTSVLWGTDTLPTFPDDGSTAPWASPMPPKGGLRIAHMIIHPDSDGPVTTELDEADAGIHRVEGEASDMHATPSLDILIMIEGEATLVLDDGKEVVLRQGDSLVQNGTRHSWHNRTSTPARVGVIVIGTDNLALGS